MALTRVGFDPLTEHDLFVLDVPSPGELPHLTLPCSRFVCLLVWNAAAATDETLAQVAEQLLDAGAVYVCCFGNDCERVHDVIDEVDVHRDPDSDSVLMTTWHTDEDLSDVVYFALNIAWPDDGFADGCGATVAVCIDDPASAEAVRAAFADPRGFTARYLR
jgi:hypothetical protein